MSEFRQPFPYVPATAYFRVANAKSPRSTFLILATLALVLISRSIDAYSVASGVAPHGLAHKPSTCIASTIAIQFVGCFELAKIATAASIWLSFLVAGFGSLAAGFATVAFFLVALVVGALVEAWTLRLVLVVVLAAMFVFPLW